MHCFWVILWILSVFSMSGVESSDKDDHEEVDQEEITEDEE